VINAMGAIQSRACRTFAAIAVALSCGACAHGSVPTIVAETAKRADATSEYAILNGKDTLGFELVTTCRKRLISDNDWQHPRAHVHYEADVANDGAITRFTAAIWSSGPVAGHEPDQIVIHHTVGDSAFTDVWKGQQSQHQIAAGAKQSFPYLINYVGLLVQLTALLGPSGAGRDSARLFYLGTRGVTGTARVIRRSNDSLTVRLDERELHAAWSSSSGFGGGHVMGTEVSYQRMTLPDTIFGTKRCEAPPFLRENPKTGGFILTLLGDDHPDSQS